MDLQALIFDMDGTLVDNMGWHLHTWQTIFAELGLDISEEEFHRRLAGRTNEAIFAGILGDTIDLAEATRRGEEKEARYRALYGPQQAPIAGLLPLLDQARAEGLHLAVATSADPPNIAFTLDACDLRRRFAVVVGGQEVARAKPEPDLFLEAARRLGVDPAACLVFEDTRSGLEAARRAGMPAVALATSLPAATLAALPGVCTALTDYRDLTVTGLRGIMEACPR